jgi:hypothetical protein
VGINATSSASNVIKKNVKTAAQKKEMPAKFGNMHKKIQF